MFANNQVGISGLRTHQDKQFAMVNKKLLIHDVCLFGIQNRSIDFGEKMTIVQREQREFAAFAAQVELKIMHALLGDKSQIETFVEQMEGYVDCALKGGEGCWRNK